MENDVKFISAAELQEILGCGRTFVYELLARNQIPSYKFGNKLRKVKLSDALAWAEAQKYRPGE